MFQSLTLRELELKATTEGHAGPYDKQLEGNPRSCQDISAQLLAWRVMMSTRMWLSGSTFKKEDEEVHDEDFEQF